jgi:hypothetical protein
LIQHKPRWALASDHGCAAAVAAGIAHREPIMTLSLQRPALWLTSALLAACAQAPVDHSAHRVGAASPAHQHAAKEAMCEMGASKHDKPMPGHGQQDMAEKHKGMQEHMAKMHSKDCPAQPAAAKP